MDCRVVDVPVQVYTRVLFTLHAHCFDIMRLKKGLYIAFLRAKPEMGAHHFVNWVVGGR